jgi:hypothetical protein
LSCTSSCLIDIKARSLTELRVKLPEAPGTSNFSHTHQKFLVHNFQRSRHDSNFTHLVSKALREEALTEKLSTIDLLAFITVRQLRDAIIQAVDVYLCALVHTPYECHLDDVFPFFRSRSIVLPTGFIAENEEN